MANTLQSDMTVAIKNEIIRRINEELPGVMKKALEDLAHKINASVDQIALNVLQHYNIHENQQRLLIEVRKKECF